MSPPSARQQQAIHACGNLLVAAGAGTGKTTTLVARCLRLLVEEKVSLENLLLVTFTEAAATEMRQRIREALSLQASETALETQAREKLEEQIALLDTAAISTLHSFCYDLVRQHFDVLGIDPALTVLDEIQTRPLLQSAWEVVMRRHLAGSDPEAVAVQDLIRRQGRGDVVRMGSMVIRLHHYLQSLANPEQWLRDQLTDYQSFKPSRWEGWFGEGFQSWRKSWIAALERQPQENTQAWRCVRLLRASEAGSTAEEGSAEGLRGQAARCLAGLLALDNEANWPWGSKTKYRPAIANLLDEAAFLASLKPAEPDPLAQDWEWVRPAMLALLKLVREFGAEYQLAKRELNGIDFADQEQLAIRLLYDAATGELTEVAKRCREQYHHVFVDEYQDINPAQDAILRAVSREGPEANRFLVGDVKQSIYRFRHARPAIFSEYQRCWQGAGSEGTTIPLTDNYRSSQGVVNFVNAFFERVMRPAVGGVLYNDQARLHFGDARRNTVEGLDGQAGQASVELCVLIRDSQPADPEPGEGNTGEGLGDEPDLLEVEKEARWIVRRLKQMHDSRRLIWDPRAQQHRPAQWQDMAVLMRSPVSRVESFAQEFHRLNVPLVAGRAGFFSALEVMDLVNLLRLLDNPFQDIPLLTVLRSPLVGLSIEELAVIRTGDQHSLYWLALQKFHRTFAAKGSGESVLETPENRGGEGRGKVASDASPKNIAQVEGARAFPSKIQNPKSEILSPPAAAGGREETIGHKLDLFLEQWQAWRQLIRHASLSHGLETILTETHYEALLLAGDRGPARVANVRKLVDLVRQYDPYQRQGLYRFLCFVEQQEELGFDTEPANAGAADAVRLLSIHQSKGLEFPIVVVAGLGARFNEQDLRGDWILSENYGICPRVYPPEADRGYPSLPYWLAQRRERSEMLGEELRLLYVAFTRARDVLVLVGAEARQKALEKWKEPDLEQVTDEQLLQARKAIDWIRLWFQGQVLESAWTSLWAGKTDLFRWQFYPDRPADRAPEGLEPEVLEGGGREIEGPSGLSVATPIAPPAVTDYESWRKLRDKLAWRYPYLESTGQAAKVTVSDLQRQLAVDVAEETEPWPVRYGGARREEIRAPATAKTTRLSAAKSGIGHHRFLERVRLDEVGSLDSLAQEAQRLALAGWLTPAERIGLNLSGIMAFWNSAIGRQMLEHKKCVQRELAFTARFTAEELSSLAWALRGEPLPPGSEATRSPAAPSSLIPEISRPGKSTGLAGPGCPCPAELDAREFVVVQGVVDLLVLLPDELWLLDYKTDSVPPGESQRRALDYRPQLALYGLALARIYRRPVTRQWLHFLANGETVDLGLMR